jgi:hypothetical protein
MILQKQQQYENSLIREQVWSHKHVLPSHPQTAAATLLQLNSHFNLLIMCRITPVHVLAALQWQCYSKHMDLTGSSGATFSLSSVFISVSVSSHLCTHNC